MFVFKAAVVGAGTMGGEIAQVIATADIPVVLKDVDQKFVDAGPREGPRGDPGPARRRSSRRSKLTQEQADAQLEQIARPDHRHHRLRRLRRRRLRDRGRARADGDQAGRVRRARRGHARPRDPRLQHLVAVDHRDGRGHEPARQGRRLPLLLPGLGDAADRGRSRATTPPPRPPRRRPTSPRQIRKMPIRCGEVPGLRGQPDPQLGGLARSGATRRRPGLDVEEIDKLVARAEGRADGAVLPRRPARARHGRCTSPSTCATPTATASTSTAGCRSWSTPGNLGAKTGKGFYEHG